MKTFSILLALDLADTSGYALEQAARLAQRTPSSELHVVHVADETSSEKRLEELAQGLQLYVAEKAAAIGGLAGIEIGIHVRVGGVEPAIVEVASEIDAAVIVLASRSKMRRLARKLLVSAPCPVVIAGTRPVEHGHATHIEAACPDCLRVRVASANRVEWCARHAKRRGLSHVYSYEEEMPFASHDSEVIPTGIEF